MINVRILINAHRPSNAAAPEAVTIHPARLATLSDASRLLTKEGWSCIFDEGGYAREGYLEVALTRRYSSFRAFVADITDLNITSHRIGTPPPWGLDEEPAAFLLADAYIEVLSEASEDAPDDTPLILDAEKIRRALADVIATEARIAGGDADAEGDASDVH